ncbi:MAG: DUF4398 domain-containing protein [Kofleriaceae bacterium]|nr:DUF4398 domain-containing protein [Kofleriaceae bacterium]
MHTIHRLKRLALTVSATLGFMAIANGCGPVEYINQVSRKASSEVEAAKSVKADKYSPYWYTLAVEYLNKAREEAAHADYQAANRFGKRSAEAAAKARELAVKRAADPSSIPVVPDSSPDSSSPDSSGVDIMDTDSPAGLDDEDPLANIGNNVGDKGDQ